MPAYVLVQGGPILNAEAYETYKNMTPSSISAHGGRFLVRGGLMEQLEGENGAERVVILEFPTMERARAWYNSPEYQAAKAVREGAATVSFTLVEGYAS